MTPTEYLASVAKNHKTEYAFFHTTTISEPLVHAAVGISTEAGELLDAVKKAIIYGKPVDVVNIKEELGDLLWYIGLAISDLDTTFEEIFDINDAKLSLRYSQGQFTTEEALNRDTQAERQVLEEATTASNPDLVPPRVEGAITRSFIRLNERAPTQDDTYLDTVAAQLYKYNGVHWLKVNKDAG